MQAISPNRFVVLQGNEDDQMQPMEMGKSTDQPMVGQQDMIPETSLGNHNATT